MGYFTVTTQVDNGDIGQAVIMFRECCPVLRFVERFWRLVKVKIKVVSILATVLDYENNCTKWKMYMRLKWFVEGDPK